MDKKIKQLILRAQNDDTEAFHELVAIHDQRIMTLALQITKNRQDAEDLYQSVFLKAYKSIKGFRLESAFYTWLYRITVNTAYNVSRKASKMQIQEPANEDFSNPLLQLRADDENYAEKNELLNAVKDSLSTLPRQQKTVFILKHLQNQKIKDIAKILDISEGSVKKYLFRAMEKLRIQLKEYRYA